MKPGVGENNPLPVPLPVNPVVALSIKFQNFLRS
jgi:hypothetical protein